MLLQKTIKNFTQNPKNDILSGLTVALALVPEAVAFAFVAGIDPLVGLYGAFMMGIVTALFGGRPGMISGATGAMAVVMVFLIQKGNQVGDALSVPIENLGLQWLFITLLIVGAIQISAGVFKLGKFVRLIPHPVMMGFVNGLAIVIFLSQLGLFKENINGEMQWMSGDNLWMMLGLVCLTMAIMYGLPKLTKKILLCIHASHLHLVKPFGFELSDSRLKRAGLDYWKHIKCTIYESVEDFFEQHGTKKMAFLSSNAPKNYLEIPFEDDLFLIFGKESVGLSSKILKNYPTQLYKIPLYSEHIRSLNLANAVSIVVYEGLRNLK